MAQRHDNQNMLMEICHTNCNVVLPLNLNRMSTILYLLYRKIFYFKYKQINSTKDFHDRSSKFIMVKTEFQTNIDELIFRIRGTKKQRINHK